MTTMLKPAAPPVEDSRILELIREQRIWDMGMCLASIPLIIITTDSQGEIIEDGPIPTPTTDFVRMCGFEFVRRGGSITAEIDAYTIARATLAIRCWPMDELVKLRGTVNDERPVIDPGVGMGPIVA